MRWLPKPSAKRRPLPKEASVHALLACTQEHCDAFPHCEPLTAPIHQASQDAACACEGSATDDPGCMAAVSTVSIRCGASCSTLPDAAVSALARLNQLKILDLKGNNLHGAGVRIYRY